MLLQVCWGPWTVPQNLRREAEGVIKGAGGKIDPVLVLSTGRCGSTLISEMVNRHPRILSLSEFFIPLGADAFARANPDGETMWKVYSRQTRALQIMLEDSEIVDEMLYPLDAAEMRFTHRNVPPILCVTLPHLTPSFHALYDELEPVIRQHPKAPLDDHYRFLFEWLCDRFSKDLWIERSGGSLMKGAKLLRLFPDARVIHVYRDGRDTALSMSRHHNFRILLASMTKARRFGLDPFRDFSSPALRPFDPIIEKLLFWFWDVEALKNQTFGLEEFGHLWSRMILAGHTYLRSLQPTRFLSLRFEDIQERPREKLRELIEFIDPTLMDEAWLDQVATIPNPHSPKYLQLEPGERLRLTQACAPGLEMLGYPM